MLSPCARLIPPERPCESRDGRHIVFESLGALFDIVGAEEIVLQRRVHLFARIRWGMGDLQREEIRVELHEHRAETVLPAAEHGADIGAEDIVIGAAQPAQRRRDIRRTGRGHHQ